LKNVPVVMFLTSRALEENVVEGLMAGADDYMAKPIRKAELSARIHALSKRLRAPEATPDAGTENGNAHSRLVCGVFELDLARQTAAVRGEPVELKPKEFAIAAMLFQNAGQIVSREKIMENVWGRELVMTSRTLDTHMSQVRTKLQLKRDNNVRLTTIYTIGYRLDLFA
jgi:DNA-binding response OmpR family regulator